MKSETVFRTPWFQISTVAPGPEASGTTEPYYCIIRQNGVIGLTLDEAGRVIMIDQHRPPLGRATLEMPAGTIEDGETPEQAMARELREETGMACARLVPITPCRLMLNRENVVEHFFVGLRAYQVPHSPEKERCTVRLLERKELLALIKSHRFEQTVALGAVYVANNIFGFDLLTDEIGTIEARLLAGPTET